MHKILVSTAVALTCTAPAMANIVQDAPLVSIASQDAYFNNLRAHCGKAFEGKVVVDNPKSPGFEGRLVMHVRKCSDRQLQIPFHVGDNHSRTWLITKTGSGYDAAVTGFERRRHRLVAAGQDLNGNSLSRLGRSG